MVGMKTQLALIYFGLSSVIAAMLFVASNPNLPLATFIAGMWCGQVFSSLSKRVPRRAI